MPSQKIQWYPGHMNKAARELREVRSRADVFIEVCDSRIPYSSSNPLLAEIRGDKPLLRVLTRADLSDPAASETWLTALVSRDGHDALLCDARNRAIGDSVIARCRALYRDAGGMQERLTLLVAGIPNVGKSTLINTVAGRKVARTGNQPAVTRQQQSVEVADGVYLLDTPGLLWPNVENPLSGLRLAVTGAIRETAMPHAEVALFAADFLAERYADALEARYHFSPGGRSANEILEEIGRRRGCLVKGGKVDVDKAARLLIGDIRDGRLGRMTWELPGDQAREEAQVAEERAAREADRARRRAEWKQGNRGG